MNAGHKPLARTGHRLILILLWSVVLVLALVLSGGVASAHEAPLAGWRQALAQVEAGLKSVKADDAAARASLARQLEQLRDEIPSLPR